MYIRLWILGVFSIGIILAAILLPPVSQPMAYHQFADQRLYFNIPNFLNVVSNLVFLLSGAMGLLFLYRSAQSSLHCAFIKKSECWPYLILFLSVVLTCCGSAYYHWAPDNERLLWDRLPIAIGVTALLAATVVERIHLKLGLWLMPVLITLGIGSVLYWYWSEQRGVGNLNFYIVTQFYSLLLIVLLGMFFPSRYTRGTDIYWVMVLYGLSKLAETFDHVLYELGQLVSGHTVKHLLAAFAVFWILRMLQRREPVSHIARKDGVSM
tara:strand:- start:2608 stop:3408 length:801 start_codon:yes stop_codon:yes gene_type:complete